jgi:hypothetical protein
MRPAACHVVPDVNRSRSSKSTSVQPCTQRNAGDAQLSRATLCTQSHTTIQEQGRRRSPVRLAAPGVGQVQQHLAEGAFPWHTKPTCLARWYAMEVPITPPPTTTTDARAGSSGSFKDETSEDMDAAATGSGRRAPASARAAVRSIPVLGVF